MKIAVASDHAGFRLKTHVVEYLKKAGHDVLDLGPANADRVDYPDFAARVARSIQSQETDRGILVCGSGIGISIAANRFKGVRAVNAMNSTQARLSRNHNDANVLCFGERLVGETLADDSVDTFLSSEFEGGRHTGRVEKIDSNAAQK